MVRTYNKTLEVIKQNNNRELYNVINNIIGDTIENTYVMENILSILTDGAYNLEDAYRLKLAEALRSHFELVWTIKYIDNTNIDRLISFIKEDIYYIDAYGGHRMATKNEVEHGVTGLIKKESWLFGDEGQEIYKQLNILQWAITGRLMYYRLAGLQYNWGENGLEDTFIQLFSRSTAVTTGLYTLLRNKDRFNYIVSTINKAVRRGRNKYPDFAPDEVAVEISKKQLLFKLQAIIWEYEGFSESKRLLIRLKKDNTYKLSPYELSLLRKDYEELTSIMFKGNKVKTKKGLTDEQVSLKEKCDKIEKYVIDGMLDKKEFSLKIVETLKKYNYNRCSEKQMNILNESIAKAEKALENKEETKVMTDADIPEVMENIYDVMNALGRGELNIKNKEGNNEEDSYNR